MLGLAPGTAALGPLLQLPRGTARATARLRVPADPALIGTVVFGQALVYDAQRLELTNTQRVLIRD